MEPVNYAVFEQKLHLILFLSSKISFIICLMVFCENFGFFKFYAYFFYFRESIC
jgi:hypothetical protein